MANYPVIFLSIAILAGWLGFGDRYSLPVLAIHLARGLYYVFIVSCLISVGVTWRAHFVL